MTIMNSYKNIHTVITYKSETYSHSLSVSMNDDISANFVLSDTLYRSSPLWNYIIAVSGLQVQCFIIIYTYINQGIVWPA